MTLIITLVSHPRVIQASDRRLTADGRPFDDNSNKAICINCRDAQVVIAYTGVARIGVTPTDRWLVDKLADLGASQLPLGELLVTMHSLAATNLANEPGLTFAIAGYRYDASPPEAFVKWLSNKGDQHRRLLCQTSRLQIYAHGEFRAIGRRALRQLKRQIANGFFVHASDEHVAACLVDVIREASRCPAYGGTIGSHCMTTSLSPNSRTVVAHYHSEGCKPGSYLPHIIMGGLAFCGGRLMATEPRTVD